jgi:hypothetical protein
LWLVSRSRLSVRQCFATPRCRLLVDSFHRLFPKVNSFDERHVSSLENTLVVGCTQNTSFSLSFFELCKRSLPKSISCSLAVRLGACFITPQNGLHHYTFVEVEGGKCCVTGKFFSSSTQAMTTVGDIHKLKRMS